MTPRCVEVDDLLAPFAIDGLGAEDRLIVLEHLSECRRHDEDLVDYRAVAGAIPLSLEPTPPPVGAREALLQRFAAEVAEGGAGVETRVQRTQLWQRTGFAYAVAAALLVVAVGLAVWNASLLAEDEPDQLVTTEIQQGNLRMQVVYLVAEQRALISVDLPALDASRTYQAWSVEESRVVSLGLLPNQGIVEVHANLSATTAVAISIEPAGGSAAATTEPILVSEF